MVGSKPKGQFLPTKPTFSKITSTPPQLSNCQSQKINPCFSRNYNYKFPDENILQFLHGLDPVHLQSCMNINFGLHNSEEKFSFSQLPMIPDDLGQEKIRNILTNNAFNCYIVSIGEKYIQVEYFL